MSFVRSEICFSRKSRGHCSRPDASVVSRNVVASLTFSGFVIDEILDPSVHLKNCESRGAEFSVREQDMERWCDALSLAVLKGRLQTEATHTADAVDIR